MVVVAAIFSPQPHTTSPTAAGGRPRVASAVCSGAGGTDRSPPQQNCLPRLYTVRALGKNVSLNVPVDRPRKVVDAHSIGVDDDLPGEHAPKVSGQRSLPSVSHHLVIFVAAWLRRGFFDDRLCAIPLEIQQECPVIGNLGFYDNLELAHYRRGRHQYVAGVTDRFSIARCPSVGVADEIDHPVFLQHFKGRARWQDIQISTENDDITRGRGILDNRT